MMWFMSFGACPISLFSFYYYPFLFVFKLSQEEVVWKRQGSCREIDKKVTTIILKMLKEKESMSLWLLELLNLTKYKF